MATSVLALASLAKVIHEDHPDLCLGCEAFQDFENLGNVDNLVSIRAKSIEAIDNHKVAGFHGCFQLFQPQHDVPHVHPVERVSGNPGCQRGGILG